MHACVVTFLMCVFLVCACIPQQAKEADSLRSVKARGFSRRRETEKVAEI